MKISIVITRLEIAGAQAVATELACYFSKHGHDVWVICLSAPDENKYTRLMTDNNVQIQFIYDNCSNPLIRIAKKYIKFSRIMNEMQPDIIHGHLDQYYLWIYSLINRKSFIQTFHSQPDRYNTRYFRIVYKLLQGRNLITPVVLTNCGADIFSRLYHIPQNQIQTIPNPINANKYYGKKCDRRNSKIIFILAARFTAIKNHEFLIYAFKNISCKYSFCELWLAGDGELYNDMVDLVNKLEISEYVKFWGEVSDIRPLLMEADISIMTSRSEAFPIFILESMCAGLPVIATKAGGLIEIVENNGIVVDLNDMDALVKAMERLITNDELRKHMGMKSYELSKKYDIDIIGRKYIGLYRDSL